jgi:hypothetical protein
VCLLVEDRESPGARCDKLIDGCGIGCAPQPSDLRCQSGAAYLEVRRFQLQRDDLGLGLEVRFRGTVGQFLRLGDVLGGTVRRIIRRRSAGDVPLDRERRRNDERNGRAPRPSSGAPKDRVALLGRHDPSSSRISAISAS